MTDPTSSPDRAGADRADRPDRPGRAGEDWLDEAVRTVSADPVRVAELFPAVGRAVGRAALDGGDPLGLVHGTTDDHARAALVEAVVGALPAPEAARTLRELYRYGDDAERRGVLYGIGRAVRPGRPDDADNDDDAADVVQAGLDLTADALRTNDPRLVAAAMGPFTARHLDQHTWRHGVLKALFMGIPLAAVADLDRRRDPELERMAAGLVAERRAAGREITDDMARLQTAVPQKED